MTAGTSTTGRDLAALVARAKTRRRSAVEHEPVGTELNLTPVQHALWLHGQRHGDVTAGVTRWVARLDGDLDVPRLAGAFRAAVRRHPALRSAVRETPEGPRRLVLDRLPDVVVLEAAGDDLDAAVEDALRLATRLDGSISPAGPVAAVTIVRAAPRTTVLALSVHHLFFDGTSLRLVLDDVARWYEDPPMDPDSVPLAEPVRAQVTVDRSGEDRAFWMNVLSGTPEPAQLVARPGAAATRRERALPDDVSAALRVAAAQVGVSMFTVMAAAQALACRQLGAGDDVVLVTPVDVRSHAQAGEVGYFVNTMPVRVMTGDEPTGRELLRRVGDDVARALDARRLPVHDIVGTWREQSGHALLEPFTTMVDVVPNGSHDLVIAGLEVAPLPLGVVVDFPLEVTLVDEHRARLVGVHRTGVLGPEGLDAVLDAVVDALTDLAHGLDQPLTRVEQRAPVFVTAAPGVGSGAPAAGTCREETLQEVLAAFAAALQLEEPPAPDAGFFDLGGHSLGAMRLGIEVRRRLGSRITVRDVFENPTARRLAVLAEARGQV